ncbi:MAG TPA: ribosome biogenesis GTP-binding protein YihA/YsxC [Vicinamibacteria bacterium]|nr:ribosome biogenesis GTP-binding protein YihA/YsxC [Vicinamibacteria bacterium]
MSHPTVTFTGSAASAAQFPRDGLPEVALLGRSNVGKSSLLNALTGVRGLARVSQEPGRTRTVNFFRVGHAFYLADLPGYGFARAPREVREGWERLVTSYLLGREPLALCLFLVDARHEPMEGDETLRAWLDHHRLPHVVVATKADKIGRGERNRRVAELKQGLARNARSVVAVSAKDGSGIDELWRVLRAATEAGAEPPVRAAARGD